MIKHLCPRSQKEIETVKIRNNFEKLQKAIDDVDFDAIDEAYFILKQDFDDLVSKCFPMTIDEIAETLKMPLSEVRKRVMETKLQEKEMLN